VSRAVRLTGIRKCFGSVVAADGVDLEIADGEFFTMLGPSGSGKTTLLRMIAGFEIPDEGTIELGGADDAAAVLPAQRHHGVQTTLGSHMTVRETSNVGAQGCAPSVDPEPDRSTRACSELGGRRPVQLSVVSANGWRPRGHRERARSAPARRAAGSPTEAAPGDADEPKRIQREVGITSLT
jgi:putative spermidine/putrescine transport system ATP-binding protein